MTKQYLVTITNVSGSVILICSISPTSSKKYLKVKFKKKPFTFQGQKSMNVDSILEATRIPVASLEKVAIRKFIIKHLGPGVKVITEPIPQPAALRKAIVKSIMLQPGGSTRFTMGYHNFAAGSNNARVSEMFSEFNVGKNITRIEDPKSKSPSIEFEVIYSTTREKTGDPTPNKFYGKTRGTKIEYGLCKVSIPEDRSAGELNRPSWLRNIILGENKKKHFVLLTIKPLSHSKFIKVIHDKFTSYGKKDTLIFIHGFKNTFADSMRRAAQLGYDLQFQGPVIAFSWPSIGTVKGYGADIDSATDAGRLLKDLLLDISQNTDCENIHIIAHSMGNVTLTEALMNLRDDKLYPLSKIKQIILAAPDLDQTNFINKIHPKIRHSPSPPRITLYASSKDQALALAKRIRASYPRAGSGGKELLVLDGIDSIDASLVNTEDLLKHSYFAGTVTTIYDMRDVLNGLQPQDRVLDSKTKMVDGIKKIYWCLRK